MPANQPHRVAHKPRRLNGHKVPYAYGCNPAAITRAKQHDYDAIDLDLRVLASRTPGKIPAALAICDHWPYPLKQDAWFDPAGKLSPDRPIHKINYDEAMRLRYRDGKTLQPMMTARWAMVLCKRVHIQPCFEAKSDPRGVFYDPEWWADFKAMGHSVHVEPIIMSLPGGGTGIKKLAAAHEAGLTTMWLWRGAYPASYNRHIDFVKSRPGHGIYRV